MALLGPNGEYAIVDFARTNNRLVAFEIYRNEATRSAPTEFDQAVFGTINVGPVWETALDAAPAAETLRNSVITAAYECLKGESRFAGWEDC
jgi:hypothetical protein